MKQPWRFIHTGACSPAINMAIDEAIMIAQSEGKAPPTIRFYGWNPPTLSIGYFQKTEEIDLHALERHRIGFVRRPTGGRAVLHDQELTYSIIVPETVPGIPSRITEAYRVLSQGLLAGFRHLGLDAQMVHFSSEEEKAKYTAASAACFDSPSWYELVVEGRKVAGSAQMRQKGIVLQHGSILLDLDIDLLFSLLRFSDERSRERLKKNFSEKAVAINELRRKLDLPEVTLLQVEQAFQKGMAEGLQVTLQPGELTAYERDWVERLIEFKYGNREWNFQR